jgi:hypothetical protein
MYGSKGIGVLVISRLPKLYDASYNQHVKNAVATGRRSVTGEMISTLRLGPEASKSDLPAAGYFVNIYTTIQRGPGLL